MHRILPALSVAVLMAFSLGAQTITIVPADPDTSQTFRITVNDQWVDSCVPSFREAIVSGGTIRVEAAGTQSCMAACLFVITPYTIQSQPIGPLSAGNYQVEFWVTDRCGIRSRRATRTMMVRTPVCLPPQVAPQVSTSTPNVAVDSAVNITWTTTEIPDRFLVETSTDAKFVTNVRSFAVPGAARSAVLRFPAAGQYFVRVSAENVCGRKEGSLVTINVSPPPARVVVAAKPSGMLQVIGESAPTDTYTLTNLGGTATTIGLNQVGNFFSQSPTLFTLTPGQSQVITLTSLPQNAAINLSGASIPSGPGIPAGLQIPVRLFVSTRPDGDPDARAVTNRVDVASTTGSNPVGSVAFTNTGTGSVKGLLVSNVPWLVVLDEFVNMAPAETSTFRFQVDRSQRAQLRGSETGSLFLFYVPGSSGKSAEGFGPSGSTPPPGSKATVVTVTDTVQPPVAFGEIPLIASDEVAYFVPGVGHVQGGAGLFISDVTILNAGNLEDLSDLRIYLVPGGGSAANGQVATFNNQLSSNQSLALADVSKSVFNVEGQVSSLQIRTKATSTVRINANIFNTSNPTGTYGTTLPVFRSTHSLGVNEKLYLTGLRKDANGRTNLYLQETKGQAASAQVQFLNAAGTVLSARTDTVQPFALTLLADAAPPGAAAAIVTNTSPNSARILAHATPVDQLTGDTWSVADWSRQYGYPTSDTVVIPVAGKLRGALNTDFRTDLSIMNVGTSTATGTLRYYQTTPTVQAFDRSLSVAPLESRIHSDVVASLFQITTTSVGFLIFTPTSGSFVTTSRTYTLGTDGVSTYGTGVPTLSSSAGLKPGETRKIFGIEDATSSTVQAGKPGTYRTNLGLAETLGQTVTVRATMRYTAVQGAAASVGIATADITLQPRQLLLEPSISTRILGSNRALFTELRDIQVDFQIVGTGEAVVFTTSTDNGTNDTALRIE